MHKAQMARKTLVLLLMTGLFIGCSKTETPTSTVDTVNVTKMAMCWISDFSGTVDIISDPTPDTSLSIATLSWGNGPTTFMFNTKVQQPGSVTLYMNITYPHSEFGDTVLSLSVHSNIGSCQGTNQMPGNMNIISPRDDDTVTIGPVTCTWAAARAEWYFVWYRAYACSTGASLWINLGDKYINTSSDSVIIPVSYFNYPGALYYYVIMEVYPYKGPMPQAGSTGNMTGTTKGFFITEGRFEQTSFFVGTPSKNAKIPKLKNRAPSRQERISKYLEAVTGQ
jgi:hypothetical protein